MGCNSGDTAVDGRDELLGNAKSTEILAKSGTVR